MKGGERCYTPGEEVRGFKFPVDYCRLVHCIANNIGTTTTTAAATNIIIIIITNNNNNNQIDRQHYTYFSLKPEINQNKGRGLCGYWIVF